MLNLETSKQKGHDVSRIFDHFTEMLNSMMILSSIGSQVVPGKLRGVPVIAYTFAHEQLAHDVRHSTWHSNPCVTSCVPVHQPF